MNVPHLAFVGYSGSGKTTLATQVVSRLKARGYRVGVLKHDAHDADLDTEGKDTALYEQAGADMIMLSSPGMTFTVERHEGSAEPDPRSLLGRFAGADIVIIEGYKYESFPKILVARTPEQLKLHSQLQNIVAVAADSNLDWDAEIRYPRVNLREIDRIADMAERFIRKEE